MVAPLDWGLGHATRCIPIIFKLIQQNCEVVVAADGAGKILLQQEFPQLTFIELKGYRMKYSRNRSWMPVSLLLQFPKLLYRVYAENRWLKKAVAAYKIDAVISDNRLGLSHKNIPCVYITHQLHIKTGSRFTESIAQKIHYHFINKFSSCWVPDAAGKTNLAGELSHPAVLPATPVIYLGPLSRFEKKEVELKYDLCIILSGPEPQRSVFEKMIMRDLKDCKGNILLIKGLPGIPVLLEINSGGLQIQDHLPAAELNQVILQSKIIISRSGYTTVMDLVKLQKKAILVPTPGQTEQEYLADYLQQQHLFYAVPQLNFSILDALKNAAAFSFVQPSVALDKYQEIMEDFVQITLKKYQ
ncbi:MAG: glycosyltransferase [Ferruginibacter sp.]